MVYTEPRTLNQLRQYQQPAHNTVREVITALREWEKVHNPEERGGMLNQFQFISERTSDASVPPSFALVPFTSDLVKIRNPLYLMPHCYDQLTAKLKFDKDLYSEKRLGGQLYTLCVNKLIQAGNYDEREICLRLQDGNQARAMVGNGYQFFDNLDIAALLEPFSEGGVVRMEHNDGLTFHLSVSFPHLAREIRVGDVVETGYHISNSEVGLRSVTIAGYVIRLSCMNGNITGNGDGSFFRIRHTGNAERLTDRVKTALDSVKMDAEGLTAKMKLALNTIIADPASVIEKMSKENELSQDAFKATLDALVGDPDAHSLFGVSNAFTSAAHAFTGDKSWELQKMGAKALAGER